MGSYIALLVLWATFVNITLELEMSEDDMKTMKGKFCGSHLADMLSLVCDGVYNNNKQKKNVYSANKQRTHDDYEDAEPVEYLDDHLLLFPFRSRERAKSIIPIEFRKRSQDRLKEHKGVVDECCYQACSIWEMSGYCGKK